MYQNAAQKTFSSAPFSPTSDSFINLNMSSHRGNIKDIVVVCMSAFLIRESIEPIQFLGFSLQVLCVFAWTFYKQYGQLLPKDIRFQKIVHHKSLEKGHAGFENNPEIHRDAHDWFQLICCVDTYFIYGNVHTFNCSTFYLHLPRSAWETWWHLVCPLPYLRCWKTASAGVAWGFLRNWDLAFGCFWK